ncbi:biotin--[acetyl-CoA-carboxylase] ligase [Scatolibacter rhodanostii]|uniref:biotin--[acetyl-CoA-carboxylase] ligase n=1 Tax=Scatolibacter rhodanostii TaxID=2014781 RepID=UPI000C084528|nr:biotin--[acetyl-CoA-carboxylase] ligase [Scatolibacter rhodanostii]
MVKTQVLDYLLKQKGQAVSGEKIAQSLGVSRNSIWKAVQNLREEGFVIKAVTNAGYKLCAEGQTLSATSILLHMPKVHPFKIEVKKSVGSTNTELKALAENGAKEGTVLIAEEQLGGKGRLGRSFYSPSGGGLYMSVILRPKCLPDEALFITVAAAVAVAQAIETITDSKAKIKWVNDIYVKGKKVCGILTEASMDFESGSVNYAVLGMGINVTLPQGGFPEEIRDVAGALFNENAPDGIKAKLAAEILTRFIGMYQKLSAHEFMSEYQSRSLLTDCQITFTQGNQESHGIVVGISNRAELIVRLDSGEIKKYSSGEASIEKESLKKILQKSKEQIQ